MLFIKSIPVDVTLKFICSERIILLLLLDDLWCKLKKTSIWKAAIVPKILKEYILTNPDIDIHALPNSHLINIC